MKQFTYGLVFGFLLGVVVVVGWFSIITRTFLGCL